MNVRGSDHTPDRLVVCTWSLPDALAEDIVSRSRARGVEPEELVRELFLAYLPEFVADALSETLGKLRSPAEEVEPP